MPLYKEQLGSDIDQVDDCQRYKNIAKMLFLALTVSLLPMILAGYLDESPIFATQSLDGHRVIDVLNRFYKDLTLLKTICSTSQQSGDYSGIMAENRAVVSEDQFKQQIDLVFGSLQSEAHIYDILDKCDEFLRMQKDSLRDQSVDQTKVMTAQSYLHYAKAETYRLLGDHVKAMSQISDASVIRQRVRGISLNELERLHALIIVQRLSEFNHEVDNLFRLGGTCEGGISRWYLLYRNSMDPLGATVSERINLDDFSGRCISGQRVASIFNEFTDKLGTLDISLPASTSERETASAYYLSVIEEVSKVNKDFAIELNDQVVDSIKKDYEREALNAADKLVGKLHDYGSWTVLGSTSHTMEEKSLETSKRRTLETYAKYFKAEIYRRSTNCNFLILAELMLDRVKNIRQTYEGISVGKLIELEGKIAFKSLICFHKRMTSIYKLRGDESNQELETRRVEHGGCESTLQLIR